MNNTVTTNDGAADLEWLYCACHCVDAACQQLVLQLEHDSRLVPRCHDGHPGPVGEEEKVADGRVHVLWPGVYIDGKLATGFAL